jgi:hypothetical protein
MMATFWRNPRVRKLSDAAIATYCLALSYACDQLNDGRLTADEALTMCARGKRASIRELVAAGFWTEHGEGYEIANYLEHNLSREDIEAKRREASEAGKRGGRPKGSGKRNEKGTLSENTNGTHTQNESHVERTKKEDDEGVFVAVDVPKPRDPSELVDHLVSGPATPALAWRLLEAVAEAYPGPDGRPVAIPGVVHSANDLTKLGALLDASGPQPMMLLACEWLALLSLIASGETDRPRGPMVPYFASRYGRLEDERIASGVPFLPAKSPPKAPSCHATASNPPSRYTEAPSAERAATGTLGTLRDVLAMGAA